MKVNVFNYGSIYLIVPEKTVLDKLNLPESIQVADIRKRFTLLSGASIDPDSNDGVGVKGKEIADSINSIGYFFTS